MMARGIIVWKLAKPQVHISTGRVILSTQATRIATSPPSAPPALASFAMAHTRFVLLVSFSLSHRSVTSHMKAAILV
jgi:hypothetical protein